MTPVVDTRLMTLGRPTADTVGTLLADAFAEEPVTRWLVPHGTPDRLPLLAGMFGVLATDALVGGLVDLLVDEASGDPVGAGLWFDRTAPGTPPEGHTPDRRMARVLGDHVHRWDAFDRLTSSAHPLEPHWYLLILGVASHRQGESLGSSLLTIAHHRLAGQGRHPAYLEATSPASRELYLRHGYRDAADPLVLPAGPPIWPMWRSA